MTGGENVYPAETENALFGHPAIADAAVIGVPDETWGEAVKAIVVLKSGAPRDAADIIAWVRARIANFKTPKSVDFVDAIPRNLSEESCGPNCASLVERARPQVRSVGGTESRPPASRFQNRRANRSPVLASRHGAQVKALAINALQQQCSIFPLRSFLRPRRIRPLPPQDVMHAVPRSRGEQSRAGLASQWREPRPHWVVEVLRSCEGSRRSVG